MSPVLPAGGLVIEAPGNWTPCGPPDDPDARLLGTAYINGVAHHLEAFRVRWNDDGQVTHPDYQQDLDDVATAMGSQGPWQPVRLGRDEYVLILTPHDA